MARIVTGDAGAVGAVSRGPEGRAVVLACLLLVVIATGVVFSPLTRYFLAQDDFILLEDATYRPVETMTGFFDRSPGHFRPMTKGLFFVILSPLFTLHAVWWHWLSLLLHVTNVLLLFVLLRRFGTGVEGALVATTIFGLNVGFFHVLAWVACTQQLLGTAVTFITMILGIDAIRGRRGRWPGVVAYVLALACFEQALALPLVLTLAVPLIARPRRRAAFHTLAPYWIVLAGYLSFILLWKTLPQTGPYRGHFDIGIIRNLAVYLGWSLDIFARIPDGMNATAPSITPSHVTLVVLIGFLAIRRKARVAVFGILVFAAFVLPALPLRNHTYFLHTYVASVGVMVLIAYLIDDVVSLSWMRSNDRRYSLLGACLLVVAALSYHAVRVNEGAEMFVSSGFKRSFVLRRANIAENTLATIPAAAKSHVVMLYGRAGDVTRAAWNANNVKEALGGGSALRLHYKNPGLAVTFATADSGISGVDPAISDVFVYDDFGYCRPLADSR